MRGNRQSKDMKAYQVFSGEDDKHGKQQWDLQATYLDKDKALAHCDTIVANQKLYDGDTIEFGGWSKCGKYATWYIHGWEYVGCCRFEEIDITE